MINWNNLDTLNSFKELSKTEPVDLPEVMSGESGAERALNYSIPMAEGLSFNYAASAVDEDILAVLVKLAGEAQLSEKFEALYNGEVINTGENRLVSMSPSRRESPTLQTKFTAVKSPMRMVRNSRPSSRSASAAAISVPARSTSL